MWCFLFTEYVYLYSNVTLRHFVIPDVTELQPAAVCVSRQGLFSTAIQPSQALPAVGVLGSSS